MTAHRFKVEIGGETLVGLAFGSESDLEEFLAGRHVVEYVPRPAISTQEPVQRLPGRPSCAAVLDAAIAAIGPELAQVKTAAGRARALMRHLAETLPPEQIPSLRATRRFLAKNLARNVAKKPDV